MDSKALNEMSNVAIDDVDPEALVEIETITINHMLPLEEKIQSFIQQAGNPYCFISGGIPVRVRFAQDGKNLSQSLINYFSLLKQK